MPFNNRLLITLFFAALTWARPASAQNGNILLTLAPVSPSPIGGPYCGVGWSLDHLVVSTSQLSTPSGPFFYAYLLGVATGQDHFPPGPGNGISLVGGLECGIDYLGGYEPGGGASPICIFSWTSCGDFQFPSGGWPAPGGGNIVTWSSSHCPYRIAQAGYFYLGAYAPAQLRVIPRPASGAAKLARCDDGWEQDVTPPLHNCGLGMIGFGGMTGFDGVCVVPVTRATWSGLKSLYSN